MLTELLLPVVVVDDWAMRVPVVTRGLPFGLVLYLSVPCLGLVEVNFAALPVLDPVTSHHLLGFA